jgi:hypothetical protein
MDKITWQDISPEGFAATIKGKIYDFGIYTLSDAIYFEDKYGPVGMTELIKNHPSKIIHEIAWKCLKDKTDFPTFENFTDALSISAARKIDFTSKVLKLLGLCLPMKLEEDSPDSDGAGFQKNKTVRKSNKNESLRRIYRRANIKHEPAAISD